MRIFIRLALVLAAMTVFLPSEGACSPVKTKKVLVLFSFDYGIHFQELFKKGLEEKMQSSSSFGDYEVDFFYEYLDLDKYSGPAFSKNLVSILRSKYLSNKPDLVIAFFKPALDLVLNYGNYIGLNGPYIYCTSSYTKTRTSDVLTILAEADFKGTADLALRLLPGTRHIAVSSGTTVSEKEYSERMAHDLSNLDKNIDIIWLTNVTRDELLNRVAKLPMILLSCLRVLCGTATGCRTARQAYCVLSIPGALSRCSPLRTPLWGQVRLAG